MRVEFDAVEGLAVQSALERAIAAAKHDEGDIPLAMLPLYERAKRKVELALYPEIKEPPRFRGDWADL